MAAIGAGSAFGVFKPKGPELSEASRMHRKLGLELSLWTFSQRRAEEAFVQLLGP